MNPTQALRDKLRRKTGESIPEGGLDSDTMVTDEVLNSILRESATLNHAIVEIWEIKLAEWAALVDVTDGAASRRMGQLREAGENQIKYYRGLIASGGDEAGMRMGRARVGSIRRREW